MDHQPLNPRTVAAWQDAVLAADAASVTYRIAPDHPAFEGHFPGNPLLPGVVQLHLCVATANRLTGRAWRLREVRRAKFMRPVLPGQALVVKMAAKPDDIFDFSLLSAGGELHAQARLQLIPV